MKWCNIHQRPLNKCKKKGGILLPCNAAPILETENIIEIYEDDMKLDANGNRDVCRVEFDQISDEQKAYTRELKLLGNQLLAHFTNQKFTNNPEEQRLWALARTELENSLMWAVKAATSSNIPESTDEK